MKKILTKKNTYLLALLVITLLGLTIIPTYAKFAKSYTTTSDIASLALNFNIGITNIEEYEEINVLPGRHEVFNIKVQNGTTSMLYYGVWYRMNTPSEKTSDITIARLDGTTTTTSGDLSGTATKTVSIIVINNTTDTIKLDIGVATSSTSASDIEYIGKKRLITGVSTKPAVNAPNLDGGNLIPVYYDETNETWKKADSSNMNNVWYDYENKRWANAIIKNPKAVIDLSNNLNNGVNKGATWDKDTGTITTSAANNTYIDGGLANYDFGSDVSFVIRFKLNEDFSNTATECLIGNWESGGGGLYLTKDNKLAFELYINGSYNAYYSTLEVEIGTWYTLVGTYDGTNIVLYINGSKSPIETSTSTTVVTGNVVASDLNILIGINPGRTSNTDPSSITVDSALIFDRALSASEIASNYKDIPTPTDKTDLLLHYDFSDGNDIPTGTTISDLSDDGTIAFYTWIPRYKYRVWNINRQGGAESTYAYQAYTKGIDIEFESNDESTGNVKCTYNNKAAEAATTLADTCVYNGTTTITTESANTSYTNAWYTHPAFTFGGKDLTGFWIGKFETGNIASNPMILPDVTSLVNLKASLQFSSSKVFQNYLSDNVDAHMLTNLEWGAVTYLMHSTYGLCNGTTCQGLYINNSSAYYTGRSGGAISGQVDTLATMFQDTSSSSTNTYTNHGYYNYKGYQLTKLGLPLSPKVSNKIASTTGNITGVYDMSGGATEYVMANMVDSSYNFYPVSAGTSWNGSATLNNKYYNSYAYGTNHTGALAFNRARLGDATAEVLGTNTTNVASWKIGSGITGDGTFQISSTYPWILRGGIFNQAYAGPFYFGRDTGAGADHTTFRSAIS